MGLTLREENYIVIELGSYQTKALINTIDLNHTQTTTIRTLAATIAPKPSETPQEPSSNSNQSDPSPTEQPEQPEQPPGTPVYVFGSALKNAAPDTITSTLEIITHGEVQDWELLGTFLRHILTREFGIRITNNDCPILFSVPPYWSRKEHESLAQIAFEKLNVPTLLIMEQPQLAVFGNGSVNGLVVDLGHSTTTVASVIDSIVLPSSVVKLDIGGTTVTEYLGKLLRANKRVCSQFEDGCVPEEFVVALKESALLSFEKISHKPTSSSSDDSDDDDDDNGSSNKKDNGSAGDSNSNEREFKFKDKTYTIPQSILLRAPQALINAELGTSQATDLCTAIRHAVMACDQDKRNLLWESIHIVGGSSRFAGIRDRVELALAAAVLPASNIFANSQTRDIRFANIPEYFPAWRNKPYLSTFLGACIAAKIALNDTRHNVNRADYNEFGPGVVHTKTF